MRSTSTSATRTRVRTRARVWTRAAPSGASVCQVSPRPDVTALPSAPARDAETMDAAGRAVPSDPGLTRGDGRGRAEALGRRRGRPFRLREWRAECDRAPQNASRAGRCRSQRPERASRDAGPTAARTPSRGKCALRGVSGGVTCTEQTTQGDREGDMGPIARGRVTSDGSSRVDCHHRDRGAPRTGRSAEMGVGAAVCRATRALSGVAVWAGQLAAGADVQRRPGRVGLSV